MDCAWFHMACIQARRSPAAAVFARSGAAVAPLERTAWQRTQPLALKTFSARRGIARLPVRGTGLVEEGKDVRHLLLVQLELLAVHLPPHARHVIPDHCNQPTHGGCARTGGAEIGRDASARSVDGVADGAVLLAVEEGGTLFGRTGQVGGMSRTGGRMSANDSHYQQSDCGACRKNPEQDLRAFTDRGHVDGVCTRNAKDTAWFFPAP